MRTFGKTGWQIQDVGLGCWQFGGTNTLDGRADGWSGVTDEESIATIERAVELGVNFFDTSDQYGWGHSEELLGRALKPFRDQVFIASKVGFGRDADGRRTFHENRGYILEACDRSLQRLRTDHIDLYQCHLWRTERWEEFLSAFESLRDAGKIRLFGVSTNDFDMVQRFDQEQSLGAVQTNYNALQRGAETEVIPYCHERGIAVIARGPLAMGRLGGHYTPGHVFDEHDIRQRWINTNESRQQFAADLERVERLRPIAENKGVTLAQLAIQFVLANAGVSVVIAGAKNRMQLEQNTTANRLPALTTEELTAIRDAVETAADA